MLVGRNYHYRRRTPTDLVAVLGLEHFEQMRFAFSDPLAAALTRQVLSELCRPDAERLASHSPSMSPRTGSDAVIEG